MADQHIYYDQPGEDNDDESEMGDGTPCWNHICTLLGAWIAFGALYYIGITLWAYTYAPSNPTLFTYTVSALGVAILSIIIIFAGITRGMETGSEESIRYVFPYTLVLCINLFVHVGFAQTVKGYLPYSIAFITCDFLSMIYISIVFYGFEIPKNRTFRWQNFFFEWFDLSSQVAVAIVYSIYSKSGERILYEKAFWSFILIQLTVWVLPIILGAGKEKRRCLRHIFLLDLITDVPLLIINLVSGAFLLQFWILIDLVIKIMFMARGFYVFTKYREHFELKSPFSIFAICACCDNKDKIINENILDF